MSTAQQSALHSITNLLQQEAERIRACEQEAEEILFTKQDNLGYKKKLLDKTEILMHLPGLVQELEEDLGPELAQRIRSRLQGFAQRAAQAEEVDSVFFMRQLLYPEDYTPGQPNDLEEFIQSLINSKKG